jgi:hypothetical protein
MNLSPLETQVLKIIADSKPEYPELAIQAGTAQVSNREYTGCGVYSDFVLPADSPRFDERISLLEEMPKLHGEHPDLVAGAGFILWCKNGLISTLECFTYDGDWPTDEQRFTLRA